MVLSTVGVLPNECHGVRKGPETQGLCKAELLMLHRGICAGKESS